MALIGMLRAGEGQVDALRFQALARQAHDDLAGGQPAAAAACLQDALALWRGDPLAEFAAEPWAVAAVARLTEARDLAAEDRIDAWLLAGMRRPRRSWRGWSWRARCGSGAGGS